MMPLLLLFLGLVLIFIEFYTPGAILGITGGVLIVFSIVFFAKQTQSAWLVLAYIGVTIVLVIGLIKFALWKIQQNKKGRGIFLNTDQEGYVGSTYPKEYIGKKGVALSDLGPSGHILIEGKRCQALSKTGYIDKGSEVLVTGGEGAHLVVKIVSNSKEAS